MAPYDPARHGPRRIIGPGLHARVHQLVKRVPIGCVVTYGDVAAALGKRGLARHIGFALAALPTGSDVPWWRVVAAGGHLARAGTDSAKQQARHLRREGIAVRQEQVVDFEPRRAAPDRLLGD